MDVVVATVVCVSYIRITLLIANYRAIKWK